MLIQTTILTIWLSKKHVNQLIKSKYNLYHCLGIGLFGISASVCWFSAFGLANAAYVKTVGQIEVPISILLSYLLFKETLNKKEYIGIGLIIAAILLFIRL